MRLICWVVALVWFACVVLAGCFIVGFRLCVVGCLNIIELCCFAAMSDGCLFVLPCVGLPLLLCLVILCADLSCWFIF